MHMPNFEKNEEIKPITADELHPIIEEFKTRVNDVNVEQTQSFSEQISAYEEFIDKLLSEKERFTTIFKTENGSIYFVMADGRSFRIKKTAFSYELEPIADQIKFLDAVGHGNKEPAQDLTPFETFFKNPFKTPTAGTELKTFSHRGHKITEIIK